MADNFQSLKSLYWNIGVNLLADFLFAAVSGALSGKLWVSVVIFVLLVISSATYLLLVKYKRLFRLIKAGAAGYYYTFDPSENSKVFAEVRNSFCYLGISANSILETFRTWVNGNHTINEYLFLLTNPESPALKRQIAYEKGVGLDTKLTSLKPLLAATIEHEVETEKKRISSAIEVLKNLAAFKDGKLIIKLHSEFIPWWMYVMDNQKIYLGILEAGKRGHQPVMIMNSHLNFPSPFDPFKNTWDRMWAEAVDV